MANRKISELPSATTPLSGTELFEIVQGGINKQSTTQDIADLGGGAVDSVNGQTGAVVLDAGDIANTPAGSIAATDVQAAINELDTEKAPLASPTFTGTPTVNGESIAPGLEAVSTTGTAISFAVPQEYGSPGSPETGNITLVTTGLVKGMVQVLYHNHSSTPTFGGEFVKKNTSGNYATGVLNTIVMYAHSSSRIEYIISQDV